MKLRKRLSFILVFGTGLFVSTNMMSQTSPRLQPSFDPLSFGEPVLPLQQAFPRGELPEKPAVPLPPGTYISPWLMDVVKLVRARIDDAVIVTFIDSAGTFSLDAEKIIFLRDVGLSGEIIGLMIQHDAEIIAGIRKIPPAPSGSPSTMTFSFSNKTNTSKLTDFAASRNSAVLPLIEPKIPALPNVSQQTPSISDEKDQITEFVPKPRTETPALPPAAWPVRQPYAVQLLDPIVMVRAAGRVPNVTVIEFPP
jgi:hypothetical protein